MSNRSPWLLLTCLMIAGCSSMTPPPQVPFPRPPAELLRAPEPLKPLPPQARSAAEALPTVTENYAASHRNARLLEAVQAWIREVYEATNGEALKEAR